MTTKVRPTFQALPPLTSWEREELKNDIIKRGVLEPVVTDEDGNVIDGHHRRAIAEELGISYPTREIPGLTDPQKRDVALALNVLRRHLSTEWKRTLIRQLVEADPASSDRAIARQVGVHNETVADERRRLAGESTSYASTESVAPPGVDRDDADIADHRGMCYWELVYGYPAPSTEERTRDGLPYPKASERRVWNTERFYAQQPAPTDDVDMQRVWRELAEAGIRLMRANPPATVRQR